MTFTALSAIGGGLLAAANLAWSVHTFRDTQRSEASKTLWDKRQTAYASLLAISARAASTEHTPEEYAKLHEAFYDAYGALEVYGTGELNGCTTRLRDILYICAHPELKDYRDRCGSIGRLHRLHLRLAYESRQSLVRTWNQPPEDFLGDTVATDLCDVQ